MGIARKSYLASFASASVGKLVVQMSIISLSMLELSAESSSSNSASIVSLREIWNGLRPPAKTRSFFRAVLPAVEAPYDRSVLAAKDTDLAASGGGRPCSSAAVWAAADPAWKWWSSLPVGCV